MGVEAITNSSYQGSVLSADVFSTKNDVVDAGLKKQEDNTESKEKSSQQQYGAQSIKKTLDQINKSAANSCAQFAYHEETNRIIVKIIDKDTKEVIKEFPPEKTLDMIAKAWELAGLLVDERR